MPPMRRGIVTVEVRTRNDSENAYEHKDETDDVTPRYDDDIHDEKYDASGNDDEGDITVQFPRSGGTLGQMEKETRYLRIWPYVRREPRVASIDIWNVRDRILHNYGKTDNEVEGFHMKVGYTIGAQFPNLWKFLKALQGLQAETEKLEQELNSGVMGREQRPKYILEHYQMFPNEKYFGQYGGIKPELVVCDPDLIRQILIKDFNNFTDRFHGRDFEADVLMQNILILEGEKWREVRHKLSPTFTSSKLKNMFYLIVERGEEFRKYINSIETNDKAIDCNELAAKFTTEVIGSVGFGVSMNCMSDDNAPFRKQGRTIFEMNFQKAFTYILSAVSPNAAKFLKISFFSRQLNTFFLNSIKDIVKQRENTNVKRQDFVDLLLELRKNSSFESKSSKSSGNILIDDKFMTAQAFVFFAAGFETTANVIGFTLHELAYNLDVQEKVIDEITDVLNTFNGKLSYDAISKMTYLEMVIMETMRKYPAVPALPRICTKQYTLPGTDLVIEKGMVIIIPVFPMHYDPKYFPEPEKFIPERFTPEEQRKRHPMVYLPFGDGPRNCIGKKLGIMQSMVALVSILRDYSVIPSGCSKKNIDFKPFYIVLCSNDGVWLNLVKRNL
ncbi:putative cytochrome P450 6a14 [Arctopsyche grandis]|uniref:putative cytochrome P450 6a14 n=1 Tax=Arctopsyche grandis TaxID=121162 RepID=UPI00406D7006